MGSCGAQPADTSAAAVPTSAAAHAGDSVHATTTVTSLAARPSWELRLLNLRSVKWRRSTLSSGQAPSVRPQGLLHSGHTDRRPVAATQSAFFVSNQLEVIGKRRRGARGGGSPGRRPCPHRRRRPAAALAPPLAAAAVVRRPRRPRPAPSPPRPSPPACRQSALRSAISCLFSVLYHDYVRIVKSKIFCRPSAPPSRSLPCPFVLPGRICQGC